MSAAPRPPESGESPDEDLARAETLLPLSPEAAFAFLSRVELVFRLNPLLAIDRWTPAEWGFRYEGLNESNGQAMAVSVRVAIAPAERQVCLHYDNGLKRGTDMRIEPAEAGARLVVIEHYPRIAEADDPRVAEVDKSLVPWVAALHRHLLARRRWAWLPGWVWWQEGFLPKLKPAQRRIARLLVWTGVLEFALFLVLVAVLALRP